MARTKKAAVKAARPKAKKSAPGKSTSEMIAEEVGKQMAILLGELHQYYDNPVPTNEREEVDSVYSPAPDVQKAAPREENKKERETVLSIHLRAQEHNLYAYRDIARRLVHLCNTLKGVSHDTNFREILIDTSNVTGSLITIQEEYNLLAEGMYSILKDLSEII